MWLKWGNSRWYQFRVAACLKVVTSGVFCLASQQILGTVSPFYHYLYVMGFGMIFFFSQSPAFFKISAFTPYYPHSKRKQSMAFCLYLLCQLGCFLLRQQIQIRRKQMGDLLLHRQGGRASGTARLGLQ